MVTKGPQFSFGGKEVIERRGNSMRGETLGCTRGLLTKNQTKKKNEKGEATKTKRD